MQMRQILKWAIRIVAIILLIAGVAAIVKREEIKRLMTVNSLFSEETIIENFSNMDAAFRHIRLPHNGPVEHPIPKGDIFELTQQDAAWLKERNTTSFLVIKDGMIRLEAYYLGTKPDDRRILWSASKSYISMLFGILLAEGKIASLDASAIDYVPELKDSAYENVRLKDLLTMSSGVLFDEDYHDYNSDINRMGRILALGGSMDEFATSLKNRFADPGKEWRYVSIDTHVAAMVLRAASRKSLSTLLMDELLSKLEIGNDGILLTDSHGVAFATGGLNFTTRDLARFGLMVAQNGMFNGEQIVPKDWIERATRPRAPTAPGKRKYGYFWWLAKDARKGEFFATGIYGQYVYIDQARNVVIVKTGVDQNFKATGVSDANIDMFRRIAAAL